MEEAACDSCHAVFLLEFHGCALSDLNIGDVVRLRLSNDVLHEPLTLGTYDGLHRRENDQWEVRIRHHDGTLTSYPIEKFTREWMRVQVAWPQPRTLANIRCLFKVGQYVNAYSYPTAAAIVTGIGQIKRVLTPAEPGGEPRYEIEIACGSRVCKPESQLKAWEPKFPIGSRVIRRDGLMGRVLEADPIHGSLGQPIYRVKYTEYQGKETVFSVSFSVWTTEICLRDAKPLPGEWWTKSECASHPWWIGRLPDGERVHGCYQVQGRDDNKINEAWFSAIECGCLHPCTSDHKHEGVHPSTHKSEMSFVVADLRGDFLGADKMMEVWGYSLEKSLQQALVDERKFWPSQIHTQPTLVGINFTDKPSNPRTRVDRSTIHVEKPRSLVGRWLRKNGKLGYVVMEHHLTDGYFVQAVDGEEFWDRNSEIAVPREGEWWEQKACPLESDGGWGSFPAKITARMNWWTNPARAEMVRHGCLTPVNFGRGIEPATPGAFMAGQWVRRKYDGALGRVVYSNINEGRIRVVHVTHRGEEYVDGGGATLWKRALPLRGEWWEKRPCSECSWSRSPFKDWYPQPNPIQWDHDEPEFNTGIGDCIIHGCLRPVNFGRGTDHALPIKFVTEEKIVGTMDGQLLCTTCRRPLDDGKPCSQCNPEAPSGEPILSLDEAEKALGLRFHVDEPELRDSIRVKIVDSMRGQIKLVYYFDEHKDGEIPRVTVFASPPPIERRQVLLRKHGQEMHGGPDGR